MRRDLSDGNSRERYVKRVVFVPAAGLAGGGLNPTIKAASRE